MNQSKLLHEASIQELIDELNTRVLDFVFCAAVEPSNDDDTCYHYSAGRGSAESHVGLASMLKMFHDRVLYNYIIPKVGEEGI